MKIYNNLQETILIIKIKIQMKIINEIKKFKI